MKRLDILVIQNQHQSIKTDYRYRVTFANTFDEALNLLQSINFDVVAIDSESDATINNMVNRLTGLQNHKVEVITFDDNDILENRFIQLYQGQERDGASNIDIKDDALKPNISCTIY